MARRRTHDEFVEEVKDLVGSDYSVTGVYINANTKLGMKHNVCGTEYKVYPNNFLKGSRCPHCAKENRRKTHEEFLNEVRSIYGDDYRLKSKYISQKDLIRVEHVRCGREYDFYPQNFLRELSLCRQCLQSSAYRATRRKPAEVFEKEVFDKVGDEYTVLVGYANSRTIVDMRHNVCGNEYKVLPASFLYRSARCPHCAMKVRTKRRRTQEDFVKEVNDKLGNDYEVVGKYIDRKTYVKLKHLPCGNEYSIVPPTVRRGWGKCPICKKEKSKGR